MSKIICDICGTTYPDTAECCPICGCTKDVAAAMLGEDLLLEEAVEETKGKGGRFSSKKKKEIFDFDEADAPAASAEEDEGNPYEEEDEYEEEPRHNTFLVILLTILIAALLVAAGFLFVRYYLPNMGGEDVAETTAPVVTEAVAETTEPTIPCLSLALTSGSASGNAQLTKEGQYFLLNVLATPENTTDEIVFTSADESIATVSADGRVTAVSEGSTVIYITCGKIQLNCDVVCSFVEETVPPTEETVAETGEGAQEDAEATEATKPAGLKDVELKLKKTDIKLGVYYSVQLELDCDLAQDEVEWSSEHSYIASVDEEGWVKALKSGTTEITAKYGDQEVSCIVRCG